MRLLTGFPVLAVVMLSCDCVQTRSLPVASGSGTAAFHEAARFDHQVTASHDGRVFVNFPRRSEGAPVSVAEVLKDELTAHDHWVCVQSVVVDRQDNVSVLVTSPRIHDMNWFNSPSSAQLPTTLFRIETR